jgi:predicted CoA-binding protein
VKTLVLGATTNYARYSNKAVRLLRQHGHEVVAVGTDNGKIEDVNIQHEFPHQPVDTLTMYLNPVKQQMYYDKILALKPRRIIFNPGAENDELEKLAEKNGIITEEACTLVLLNTGQYEK